MTKSELIERLAGLQSHLSAKTVEEAVKEMLDHMADTLADGERIEVRGFGSFRTENPKKDGRIIQR